MSKGPGVADEADLAELIGILARVRSLEQRYFESLALADRALEIAEPMELFEVIADALGTKGNILTQHGRSIEGVSLLETAQARRPGARPHRDGGARDHRAVDQPGHARCAGHLGARASRASSSPGGPGGATSR